MQRDNGNDNSPTCIAHYWPDYDQRLVANDKRPRRFLDFVDRGHAERRGATDIHFVVERVAEAMLCLAEILNPAVRYPRRTSRHRQIIALLGDQDAMRERYLGMTFALATGRRPTSAEEWQKWCGHILRIVQPLLQGAEAGPPNGFLDWVADVPSENGKPLRHGNIFSLETAEPVVEVKVGTIHSVKGETHKATLILDTHYNGSHLARIKAWLTGERTGIKPAERGVNLRSSLKQHYVAMTRPTDLLCVAMRATTCSDADLARVTARDWAIGDVVDRKLQWRR
ncbi:hypothetical protein [Sphingobium chungangianum]